MMGASRIYSAAAPEQYRVVRYPRRRRTTARYESAAAHYRTFPSTITRVERSWRIFLIKCTHRFDEGYQAILGGTSPALTADISSMPVSRLWRLWVVLQGCSFRWARWFSWWDVRCDDDWHVASAGAAVPSSATTDSTPLPSSSSPSSFSSSLPSSSSSSIVMVIESPSSFRTPSSFWTANSWLWRVSVPPCPSVPRRCKIFCCYARTMRASPTKAFHDACRRYQHLVS